MTSIKAGSGRRRRRRSGGGRPRAAGRAPGPRASRARGAAPAPPRGLRPGALSSSGSLATREARQAALAGAEDLALAAQQRGRPRPARSRRGSRSTACSRRRAIAPASVANSRHCEGCSPRPTRPRSWCSWETPKRSAPSISITVAFGTSIPTSITVVATSTSVSPGGEGRHRRRLLGRVHLPVEQPDPEVAQLAAAQPLGLLPGRLAGQFLGDLDQRADDERLAPLAQPLAQELVGASRSSSPTTFVVDRLAPRRAARAARSCRGRRRRSARASAGSASRSCGGRAAPSPRPPWSRAPGAARPRSGAARRPRRGRGGRSGRSARSARGSRRSAPARRWRAGSGRCRRTGAAVAPVSSANGVASAASRRPRVIACCSASVSVGAISAAW